MNRPPQKPPGQQTRAILGGKFEFKCTGCGASMPLDASSKIINCEYCGAQNVVPDKLREMLKPPPQPEASPYHPQPPVTREPFQVPQSPYTYTPPAQRATPRIALIILPLAIMIFVAGITMFLNFRATSKTGGSPSVFSGGGGGSGSDSIVVPSFKQADVSRTIENMFAVAKQRWTVIAKIGRVSVNRIKTDGTVDLTEGSEGYISVSFFDVSKLGRLLPGETSVKGAEYSMYAANGGVSMSLGDASLYEIEDLYPMDVVPQCPVSTLMTEIKAAGYPSIGYGNVNLPGIPYEIEQDWLKLGLPSFKTKKTESTLDENQKEALKKKLLKEGWLEQAAYTYMYYVSGFDSSDKPTQFRFKDCKPADGPQMKSDILKDLGAEAGEEPAAPSQQEGNKKKRYH